MRIRTIKPEFWKHEDLFDAESETGLPLRLAFIGLWGCADRCGRFKWRARSLKSDIMPYDEMDFSRVLDALATRGFIVKYSVDGVDYGAIPTFEDHQVINNRERESVLPPYSVSDVEDTDYDACVTCEPRVDDAACARTSGREGKGRERKGKDISAAPPVVYEGFEEFWNLYNHKLSRKTAIKAWSKLNDTEKSLAMSAVSAYVATTKTGNDPSDRRTSRAHAASWLNAERWTDVIESQTPTNEPQMGRALPDDAYENPNDPAEVRAWLKETFESEDRENSA